MQELEFDHKVFEQDRAGDDKLFVTFYPDVLPDEAASAATGIRKFRDADMIRIIIPGSKTNIIDREVRDDDKVRFPKQWERYKAGDSEQVIGFPLKEWPLATRAIAEELKYLGFRTVEQVAGASDAIASKYPGFRELQRRAKIWLEAQESAAPVQRMQSELEARDQQLALQKKQLEELAAKIAVLQAANGKKQEA
jgi:hypothetical protein